MLLEEQPPTGPKRRGLSLPPRGNAATRLQDLEAPPADAEASNESLTDLSNDLITQISNPVSNEVIKETSTYAVTDVSTQASEASDPPATHGARKPSPPRRGPKAAAGAAPAGYAGVRDRLQIGAGKEPLVRLSVDVTESMHTRIKQYCATNRIPSSRMLIVTLLEDFLDSEGF